MRLPFLVGLGLVVSLVSGCAPAVERARSAPVVVAAFASEDEALAAATEAYVTMTEVADKIGREGGSDASRLAQYATGDFLAASLEDFEEWARLGKRQTGSSLIRGIELQQFDASSVVVYLCEDVTGVDVVDRGGVSTASPSRPDTFYLQVTLEERRGQVLVEHRELWDNREC